MKDGACQEAPGYSAEPEPSGLGPSGEYPSRLAALKRLSEAAAPGPWRECGADRKGCTCCTVWSVGADVPVASMNHGDWGDDYPSLRFVDGEGGEGSIAPKIEAYMEQITYGHIPVEVGKANAALMAAAVNFLRDYLATASVSDGSGEAGETEGLDPKDDSAARQGDAQSPSEDSR